MKKAFISALGAATLLYSFAISGCSSKINDFDTEEMHHDHDHNGHKH